MSPYWSEIISESQITNHQIFRNLACKRISWQPCCKVLFITICMRQKLTWNYSHKESCLMNVNTLL